MVGLILGGKLGLAPVRNPKNVLDVATGTGIWAIEYGKPHRIMLFVFPPSDNLQPRSIPNQQSMAATSARFNPRTRLKTANSSEQMSKRTIGISLSLLTMFTCAMS